MTALICLATYNGALWLPQQLESLQGQDDPNWQLLASDDGSGDGSWELLSDFARRESRCELLPRDGASRGACGHFEVLLRAARQRCSAAQDELLLCDQDDIWLPQKLRLQREALHHAMASCTELQTIDHSGLPLGRLLAAQNCARSPTVLSLLAQNSAVGCTLAFRREILDMALPFPATLCNHDWWLALCAAVLGEIAFLDEPLVHYRQHAANAIGAYRPTRQWTRLPALLRRQHRVLRSQRDAVAELAERLRSRGRSVPAVLDRYIGLFAQGSALTRAQAMLVSEFAAPSGPLRFLRALAIMG